MLTWINYRKIYKTRRGCDTQKTTSPRLVVLLTFVLLKLQEEKHNVAFLTATITTLSGQGTPANFIIDGSKTLANFLKMRIFRKDFVQYLCDLTSAFKALSLVQTVFK